jgi:hypothetical protein
MSQFSTPTTLSPSLQRFETRLRDIISKIQNTPEAISRMTEVWNMDLTSKSTDQFAFEISERTLGDAKHLLGGINPPTVEQLQTLTAITDEDCWRHPGDYLCLALGHENDSTAAYVGESVKAGVGIGGRTREHGDPIYRESERRGLKDKYFYRILDNKTTPRNFARFALLKDRYASDQPADQIELRIRVALAEQVFMSWLGTYDTRAINNPHKFFVNLCPWKLEDVGHQYFGANQDSPVRQNIVRPTKSMPVDKQTFHKRKVDLKKAREAEWNDLQRELKQRKDAVYSRLIKIPIRSIKNDAEKKTFRKATAPVVKAEYAKLAAEYEPKIKAAQEAQEQMFGDENEKENANPLPSKRMKF